MRNVWNAIFGNRPTGEKSSAPDLTFHCLIYLPSLKTVAINEECALSPELELVRHTIVTGAELDLILLKPPQVDINQTTTHFDVLTGPEGSVAGFVVNMTGDLSANSVFSFARAGNVEGDELSDLAVLLCPARRLDELEQVPSQGFAFPYLVNGQLWGFLLHGIKTYTAERSIGFPGR